MEWIKALIADSFNGFTLLDLPFLLLQLFVSALLTLCATTLFKEKDTRHKTLIALLVCLVVALARHSVAASVVAAAVILWLKPARTDEQALTEKMSWFTTMVFACLCGFGFVVPAVIGFVIAVPLILVIGKK